MKKLGIVLVLIISLLLCSCGYKLSDSQDILVSPDRTEYRFSYASYLCVPRSICGYFGRTLGFIKSDGLPELPYRVFTPPNAENINIVCLRTTSPNTKQEIPYLYVAEGFEVPIFSDVDEIDTIYVLKNSADKTASVTWLVDEEYSLEYLEDKKLDVDYQEFTDGLIKEKVTDENLYLGDYPEVGALVYKFKGLGDLFFEHSVYYSQDENVYYFECVVGEEPTIYRIESEHLEDIFPV